MIACTICSNCGYGDSRQFGVHEMTMANIVIVIASTRQEVENRIYKHSNGGDNSDRERGAMLSSVLDLRIITVEEIMKHRSDVIMIDFNMDYSSILEKVQNSSFTRHPVFSGKIENIIGVLHVKDILKKINNALSLRSEVRKTWQSH